MRMRGNYVKRLRGMCTLCPLSEIEGSIGGMTVFSCCGDWRRVADVCVQTPSSRYMYFEGGSVCLQRSPKRERHACPGAVHIQCTLMKFSFSHEWKKIKRSVDMLCAHKTKRNQLLQWNTNSLAESYSYLATVQLGRSRSPKMLSIHLVIIGERSLATEVSLPSRLNGTIFLYIIGERERANLVVQLARFFTMYIYY